MSHDALELVLVCVLVCVFQPNTRWEDAEEMYERALQVHPQHPQTLCNYAGLNPKP